MNGVDGACSNTFKCLNCLGQEHKDCKRCSVILAMQQVRVGSAVDPNEMVGFCVVRGWSKLVG